MQKAFVLGAGLGTRLRPLTDQVPKPLVPVFHRPLITYAFDHLLDAGVAEFIVNTHHLPEAYTEAFPQHCYRGAQITFRHEPVLLETAGGIANIGDLVRDAPFVVYNGDILTDLPLAPLLAAHERSGNLATLALRSTGPGRHIAYDAASGRITDIRGKLGTGQPGSHQFTGIYVLSPEFLRHLTLGKIESVIPIWLELIRQGAPIGGVVLDEGHWWDLGDRANYLQAHQAMPQHEPAISPEAHIDPSARLTGLNVIAAGATVGPGAVLQDCILWQGARVEAGATLTRCIVRRGMTASGSLVDADA
ncbi:MAG: sugar phosphate nucleotidyltransferase [Roseimicrobium sp.]